MADETLYAVIADVHSNSAALEAVLAHARRRGADQLLDLGDSVYGPIDPGGTVDLLRGAGMPTVHVRGNQDRTVLDTFADLKANRSLEFTRSRLSPDQLAWLRQHPAEQVLEGAIRLCHGAPGNDEVFLLEGFGPTGNQLRGHQQVARMLGGIPEDVLLCAHTHLQRVVQLPRGPLVVNPGSVGSPAFADTGPVPYRVESGSPHARYALLHRGPGGFSVEQVAVSYDHEGAARQAEQNGRPDWAYALRTGWAL